MKKITTVLVLSTMLFFSGCLTTGKGKIPTAVQEVNVWWGTKPEIIEFLNSPGAQSERWFIQSLGR